MILSSVFAHFLLHGSSFDVLQLTHQVESSKISSTSIINNHKLLISISIKNFPYRLMLRNWTEKRDRSGFSFQRDCYRSCIEMRRGGGDHACGVKIGPSLGSERCSENKLPHIMFVLVAIRRYPWQLRLKPATWMNHWPCRGRPSQRAMNARAWLAWIDANIEYRLPSSYKKRQLTTAIYRSMQINRFGK